MKIKCRYKYKYIRAGPRVISFASWEVMEHEQDPYLCSSTIKPAGSEMCVICVFKDKNINFGKIHNRYNF